MLERLLAAGACLRLLHVFACRGTLLLCSHVCRLPALAYCKPEQAISPGGIGFSRYSCLCNFSPEGPRMKLDGIHHITAITGDAARNVDLYTRVLGLRMTAKTVNQDDPSVYHLFYGDELARPGADLTFFEYPHAAPGRPGAGMIHRIVWRVASADALRFWADPLAPRRTEPIRAGDSPRFSDFEGLAHELVVATAGAPPAHA